MHRLDIAFRDTGRRTCRVRVGRGVSDDLIDWIASEFSGRLLVLVSDSNVAPLHGDPLLRLLRERGLTAELLGFPAGESSKVRATKSTLEDRLFDLGAGRDTVIVAVGGGVTGDLAGFLAATWHRGVPVVQVPTSLLAMADAALGGKTAVNLPGGKNLVGAFHQPAAIYADVDTLATLPEGPYVEGFAEVVKSAAIADLPLFRLLEGGVDRLRSRDPELLEDVVVACMRIKGRVVRRDEREHGRRAMLNFGHTVAHAVEAASGFDVRHGEAVAYGMCVEGRLAVDAVGFSPRHLERLRRLLGALRLPTRLPNGLAIDRIVDASYRDKKVRGGRVRYALPTRLGRMPAGDEVTVALDDDALRAAIETIG